MDHPRAGIWKGLREERGVDSVDEDSHIGGGDLILVEFKFRLDADYEGRADG